MSEKNVTFFGNVKLIVASILGVILLLFALQNMARVDVTFLFWTFEARRVVVIVMSFVIGIAVGWLLKAHRSRT
ncbi:MAG: LapA family protein [Rhizobiaceae bacterium]|nr:LapA family protein [Rhizobiaceae bacterium]|tara:strand:+ start:31813 stop:32034 length:222 start_codon:yes stop_codon:yes gene_type:complete